MCWPTSTATGRSPVPDDALPQPWPEPIPGIVHHERVYRDVLGRPMRGSVRITGAKRAQHGELVVAAAGVTVPLVDGRLTVDLPAGTYEMDAALTSADGERVKESETVELTTPEDHRAR